ncbi:hypothetical protein HK098_002721 [Nowakowskiella sp. JEL0407]|nr:hypothetical protein HK098_002721 [Nowakowskiella sp. JEL0407]
MKVKRQQQKKPVNSLKAVAAVTLTVGSAIAIASIGSSSVSGVSAAPLELPNRGERIENAISSEPVSVKLDGQNVQQVLDESNVKDKRDGNSPTTTATTTATTTTTTSAPSQTVVSENELGKCYAFCTDKPDYCCCVENFYEELIHPEVEAPCVTVSSAAGAKCVIM